MPPHHAYPIDCVRSTLMIHSSNDQAESSRTLRLIQGLLTDHVSNCVTTLYKHALYIVILYCWWITMQQCLIFSLLTRKPPKEDNLPRGDKVPSPMCPFFRGFTVCTCTCTCTGSSIAWLTLTPTEKCTYMWVQRSIYTCMEGGKDCG